jgi:hypothetical protein
MIAKPYKFNPRKVRWPKSAIEGLKCIRFTKPDGTFWARCTRCRAEMVHHQWCFHGLPVGTKCERKPLMMEAA